MDAPGLMNQTITLEARAAIGKGGLVTFSAGVSYEARVEYKQKMYRYINGSDKVSTARVYLDGAVSVAVTDRMTMPDGTQPEILEIKPEVDGDGETIFKVVFV
jgi:hypothetical protein